ncbi:MerR family transcriptional regulator [Paenibacillus sp. NPDC057934]|uniref:MerR family transcriptional regulator n=1 Tax=Paenibacillus sp. NPDC057934 TaxID=3346282 RepID=UPI0036DD7A33
MQTTFSIGEISKETGLSYDTIRYYEKIGLLPPVKRQENGRKEYEKSHLDRFNFISRLKQTHMPLKEIERYMTLASDHNYENCYNLLNEHKLKIESQLSEIQATLKMVSSKMDYYTDLIKRQDQ